MANKHIGTAFDDFLTEEGILEECEGVANNRVLAWQIAQEMDKQKLSKVAMAAKMKTSRSALNRLLDPENDGVTLHTMQRAAAALGGHLRLELISRLNCESHGQALSFC